MAKRKRKKPGLKADPKRQAHNSLRGYLYQIWHSVNAWLGLNEDEILYLEGAEDFDKVSDNNAAVTQVKAIHHNITLRSDEVNDAINHYWQLRTDNPGRNVKFRFLTCSKIGVEQGNPFRTGNPGLQVWSRCSGDEESIKKISNFLQTAGKICEEAKEFLKHTEPQEIYEQLIEPISWETGSKEASFVEKSVREKLIYHGDRHGISPSDASNVVNHLLKEALTVATKKENRELTKVGFLEIFEEQTTQRVPIQDLRRLQTQAAILGNVGTQFIGGSSDITIQSQHSVQYTVPSLYPDVTRRTELLTSIQDKLQSEGIVVIHGGTGRGKTTLANLTAQDTSDSWFWQSFTNRESPQVIQQLQQIATHVCNQSSQPNVVLDDLNLQPQQLRSYEEVLGIVVYRVLERSGKLLITSQQKMPNSLLRQLGVSSPIVVQVPDFTKSEIEQFAEQLGCPADDAKNWAQLIQLHTSGHPRLVHARLAQLREEGWRPPDTIESILQTPRDVVEEREEARRLLTELPDNQREFLYRLSLMPTGFRRDYALNIGEIPGSISHPGDVFDRLVGPWIDRVHESYFAISPLLTNASKQVWSESKINDLHAQIADAILKSGNLTQMEAQAVLFHSMVGHNEIGFIAVIQSLMTAPQENWKEICQEFLWVVGAQPDVPEKFFPGNALVSHLFRSLQYRTAVEVEPESAPKILEIWDKESKPHEPRQLYLLNRLVLATEALRNYQVPLSAQQIIGYFKEIIDITDNDNEVQEIYYREYMAPFEAQATGTSNYFSILFSVIYNAPRAINPTFLNELIDAVDELPQEVRTLLLADFSDDNVDSRLLIDGVWWAEANSENPDWKRCLQIFDKAIDKAIAWGFPHLAAASARGKAVIYDEYLHNSDSAHEVLQDIVSKVGILPVIEEEQANVYFGQKHYREALNIYERILPKWNPPSEQLNLGPLDEYRRAAICAAELNHWEKAATFFEEAAIRTERTENSESYIGLYADAGFAQFRAGDMPKSIKLLNLALKEFEKIPQDNTNVKYFTLKQRLVHAIRWMAEQNRENNPSELVVPLVGMCSDPETNEDFLSLPDVPMGYAWLYLAQIEYRFGHGSTALEHALRISDRNAFPTLNFSLSLLEIKYDFRNKTFDDLPKRIHQLVNACDSVLKHNQTNQGIGAEGTNLVPSADPSSIASVQNIVTVLVTALLVRLRTSVDVQDMLVIWRSNSSELPIKENLVLALDLIESMLSGDLDNALTVMNTPDAKHENRLAAALKIVHKTQNNPEALFYAHTLIATSLIDNTLEDSALEDIAELFSGQWLEKIKFPMMLKMPMTTAPDIERACKGSETGKRKIGHILLAVYQAVSLGVSSTILQQFRSWTESIPEQKPEPKTEQNPIAQQIIKVMENPPHLTYEDGEALRQSIEEGKMPVKYDSPFEPDEPDNQ